MVSARLAARGRRLEAFPLHEIELRGRAGLMAIRVIEDARALPVEGTASIRRASAPWMRLLGRGRRGLRPAP